MSWRKAIAIVVLIPVAIVFGYVSFLWLSYTSKTIDNGAAYGFTVGKSKAESAASLSAFREAHPKAVIYVTTGPRAGDYFTVPASRDQLRALQPYGQWEILLNGPGQFNNSIRLTFDGERLARIYRHRQYFELP